jgi:hypothetical protein
MCYFVFEALNLPPQVSGGTLLLRRDLSGLFRVISLDVL